MICCVSNEGRDLLESVKNHKVIIYGAHLIAIELYRFISVHVEKLDFIGFAVTSLTDNPNTIENYCVREFDEYRVEKDTIVLIAMPQKYHKEVSEFVKNRGFQNIICVSQNDMEYLKSLYILKNYIDILENNYVLYEDKYDKSWLNIRKKGNDDVHFKFPTLYYRKIDEIITEMNGYDLLEMFEQCFGSYQSLSKVKTQNIQKSKEIKDILKIYMAFSQWDNGNRSEDKMPEWIVPIQAGSILTEVKSNAVLDEVGENISSKNRALAELTVAYWIWKNDNSSLYKGLCHYRRHFVISEEEIRMLEYNDIDVILTIPRYAPGGVGKMFLAETPVKEPIYQNMINAVRELYAEDAECFENYLNKEFYVPNNMVIAKNDIYNSYCEWFFPILLRMLEMDVEIGYGHDTDRHVAYAAELLTSFYFVKRENKLNIYVTDYYLGG